MWVKEEEGGCVDDEDGDEEVVVLLFSLERSIFLDLSFFQFLSQSLSLCTSVFLRVFSVRDFSLYALLFLVISFSEKNR